MLFFLRCLLKTISKARTSRCGRRWRPYDCFICLTRINVNMLNATVTPCCQRRVHRQCYQTHVHTSNTCGHCREPLAVHEAQAMATIANPEPEHPFRQADMELCEQQRQQAIRDLEALLQPGSPEARIERVCLKVLIFSEAVFSNREVKPTTFFNFSCQDFSHLPVTGCNPFAFLSVAIFSFETRVSTLCILCYLSYKNLCSKKNFLLFTTVVIAIVNYRIYFIFTIFIFYSTSFQHSYF